MPLAVNNNCIVISEVIFHSLPTHPVWIFCSLLIRAGLGSSVGYVQAFMLKGPPNSSLFKQFFEITLLREWGGGGIDCTFNNIIALSQFCFHLTDFVRNKLGSP